MKLLLDTHALVWWLSGDSRLGDRARDLLESPETEVLVSIACFWEIVIKVRSGKLRADVHEMAETVARQGFRLLGVELRHLLGLAGLPTVHRDPFDHLLIAQAIAEGATFLTADRRAADYPVHSMPCAGGR